MFMQTVLDNQVKSVASSQFSINVLCFVFSSCRPHHPGLVTWYYWDRWWAMIWKELRMLLGSCIIGTVWGNKTKCCSLQFCQVYTVQYFTKCMVLIDCHISKQKHGQHLQNWTTRNRTLSEVQRLRYGSILSNWRNILAKTWSQHI